MTIRDIAIAFGYEVDKKTESKAEESIQALKDTATKALGAIGIGFSIGAIISAVKSIDAVSEALDGVKEDWSEVGKEMDEALGFTKLIVSGIKKVSAAGIDLVRRITPRLASITKRLGGTQNALKLLAVIGGTILAAMNLPKIASGLGTVLNLVKSIRASTLLLIAVFLVIALLIEDFVAFMQGRDSLIGEILKQTGVDCDALREKIRATWDNIKKVFLAFGDAIKGIVLALFSVIRQYWDQNGEAIKKKVSDTVVGVIDKLNAFSEWLVQNRDLIVKVAGKVLTLVAAFVTVKSGITKAITAFKAVQGIVSKAGTAFKLLSSPIGIAAAAIVAIAAIAWDFFNFMSGKGSVIGTILEKAGVDTEAVRQKITAAWEKVKSFLLSAWNTIKSVCSSVWGGIKNFFNQHGEQIKSGLTAAWNVIKTVLLGVWNAIKTVATTVFGGLQSFWSKHGEQIKTAFSNIWTGIKNTLTTVWNILKTVATAVFNGLKSFWETWGGTIMAYFSGVWETIKAVFSAVLDVLADLFAVFSALFAGDWSGLWENVKQLASDVWNGILNIISTILTAAWNVISSIFTTIWGFISDTANNIWNAITTAFTNILNSITGTIGNIKDAIVNGLTAAIDWIKGLPAQALQWGRDIIMGIVDGIKGAIGAVGDAVKGVADKIKGFLGFSEPDEGPLSDFHTYMPDMIDLMAKGIQAGKKKIEGAVGELAGGMSEQASPGAGIRDALSTVLGGVSALAQAAKPSVATTNNATTNSSNVSKVITQNVEINQEFNGDRAAQKDIAKAADSATEDTTSALARALAYAGG